MKVRGSALAVGVVAAALVSCTNDRTSGSPPSEEGETATCSGNDAEPPQIACPANIVRDNDTGACGAVVTYTAPVGTDNCSGATTAQTAGLPSGSLFPLGTATHTFTVADAAGNTASCSFTVAVNDAEPPQIACPANIVRDNDTGACGAVVTYTAPVGTDNCSGATTAQTAGLPSGSLFPLGTATYTFTVADAAGNTASCSFTVTVDYVEPAQDTTPPTITCPAPLAAVEATDCLAAVPDVVALVTVSDNCNPDPVLTLTQDLPAGTLLGLGSHALTVTATDAAGNVATCETTFTVSDQRPPVPPTLALARASDTRLEDGITSANTLTITGTAEPGATVEVREGGVALPGTALANGSSDWTFRTPALAEGAHTFTAVATDCAGNASPPSAALAVIVDYTPPVITGLWPADGATVGNDLTLLVARYSDLPRGLERFPPVTIRLDAATETAIRRADGAWATIATPAAGTHTWRIDVRDLAGNTTTATANFTVSSADDVYTTRIDIDTSKPTPLTPGFSGFNKNNINALQDWDPRYTAATADLRPGWVRFPGGTEGDFYDWFTGGFADAWGPLFKNEPCTSDTNDTYQLFKHGNGFDGGKGFLKLADSWRFATAAGAGLILCVNGFADTARSAGALARWIRNNGVQVKYVALSNEAYNFHEAYVCDNVSGGHTVVAFPDAVDYGRRMLPYAQAIRKEIPGAKIVLMMSNGRGAQRAEFDQPLADELKTWPPGQDGKPLWDGIDLHLYASISADDLGKAMKELNGALDGFLEQIDFVPSTFTDYFRGFGSTGPDILITEYNAQDRTVVSLTQINGVFVAEFVARRSVHPNVKHVGFHVINSAPVTGFPALTFTADEQTKLVNRLKLAQAAGNLIDGATEEIPTLYLTPPGAALKIANEAVNASTAWWPTAVSGGGTVEVLWKNNPEVPIPALHAQAYRGANGKRYVLVTHKAGAPHKVKIVVDGVEVTEPLSLSYTASLDPALVAWPAEIVSASGTSPIGVPAYSVTRVEWTPAAAGTPPPKPSGLAVVPGDGKIDVSWSASPGATGYRVRYGPRSGEHPYVVEVIGATSYPLAPLVNGIPYFVTVTAFSGGGQSASSIEVSATPIPTKLFADDFAAGAAKWTLDAGGWTSSAGSLVLAGDGSRHLALSASPIGTTPFPSAPYGEPDYVVEATIRFSCGARAGLVGRYMDANHYLAMVYESGGSPRNFRIVQRTPAGESDLPTLLTAPVVALDCDTPYRFRFTLDGGLARAWVQKAPGARFALVAAATLDEPGSLNSGGGTCSCESNPRPYIGAPDEGVLDLRNLDLRAAGTRVGLYADVGAGTVAFDDVSVLRPTEGIDASF